MKEPIEYKWDLIGAKLANLSDDEQSQFFMGFAKEIDSWETHYQKEMQMVSINKKLTKDVVEILVKYLPTICYKEAE